MNVHIALYKWKDSADIEQVEKALKNVESLATKVKGILDITTGLNTSRYGEGYTHAILVRGEDQTALHNYRNHPDHAKAAEIIESMEDKGIGIDFSTDLS